MKKPIFFMALLLLLSLGVSYAQELGCCTNPNAGAFSCSNERLVRRDECCPTPESSHRSYYDSSELSVPSNALICNRDFFFVNEECSSKSQCGLGCCCSELGGVVKSKIQCRGNSVFHDGQLECNSICPPPQCIDGVDNDNNGCADFENGDTGCTSIADSTEQGGICADTGPQCSSASYSPKITNLNVNPVKGEKKFTISWTDECQSVSSHYEIFRCQGNCTNANGELIATANSNIYTDQSALSFGINYNYRIVAFYSIPRQASSNRSANLGDEQCLGRFTNNVFCANNSGYTCNSQNRLSAEGTRCTSSQVCVVNQNKASCANKSMCNYNSANPFGMFYAQQSCEEGRFCFYDKSHSIVNSCFSCSDKMACYDYKTKAACERNNCNIGSCAWKDSEAGGVCVNPNDYNCKWCDKKGTQTLENTKVFNEVFDVCTKPKSQALSLAGFNCFYKNSVSKNCNQVICKDYDSAEDCPETQITLDATNAITRTSPDQCAIKVCQKISGNCVKNADGNSEADCQSDGCELDYYPPNTSMQVVLTRGRPSSITLSVFDKSGPNGSSILRTSSDYATFLCARDCSNFNISTSSRRLIISGLALFDGNSGQRLLTFSEGQNELRYFTKDPAKNLEIVKTAAIEAHANTSSPIIKSVNVTGGNKVGQRLYTSNSRPAVSVEFFEPATITYARLISANGFGFNMSSGSTSENHVLLAPAALSDGNYAFEVNAKNARNVFMERQGRFDITIDSIGPILTLTPKNADTINTSSFSIQLDFSEEVQIESARFNSNDILQSFRGLEGKKYTAQVNTTDGQKTFSVVASDFAGNRVSREITFTVDANPTNITLISPRYGVSPDSVFDVVVETDNNAQCRYSFDTEFEYDFMEKFNSSGTSHIIRGFSQIKDSRAHRLHVKCKDSRNREASRQIELSVDTTAPVLRNVFAYPSPVVESPGYTKLTVESDEAVICKYSSTTPDFDAMQFKFSGFDEANFRTTNAQNITLPDEGRFEYNTACRNRAGLVSEPKTATVEVNFSTEISLVSKTQEFFNTTTITLIVETNKRSQCLYSETDETARMGNLFGSAAYIHRKDLVVTQGSHRFYIVCRDSFLSIYSNVIPVTLTVDTTAPAMEYVDDTTTLASNKEKSCFLDRLRVKMQASDNESRVKEYFYSLARRNDNSIIVNNARTTAGGDWIQVRNLNLSNNTEYFFSAKSKNYVNFESDILSSDGVTIDTSSCSSSNISCKDRGDCPVNSSCSDNSECITDYCVDSLCRQATCTDTIKNQQESAADCGGPCPKCSNGKDCTANSDCASGNCNFGTCKEQDKCFDGQLTPGESDVDCAGPCLQRCSEGSNCDTESSCQNGLDCVDSRCIKRVEPEEQQPAPTDKDGDGIPDNWELDNGMDPNDPEDANDDDDDDGLTNKEEYLQQDVFGSTDPNAKDTDGDGFSDLEEANAGTNPLDAEDFPKSSIWGTLLFIIGIIAMVSGFGYLGYTMIQKKGHRSEFSPRQTISYAPRQMPVQKPLSVQRTERQLIRRRDEQKEKERKELFDVFDENVKDIDSGKAQPPSDEFEASETEKKAQDKSQDKKPKQKSKAKTKEDVFQKLKEISSSKKSRKKKS